ncbi:MAG: DegV family protein [Anaerolineales bacterium]|jgi:DegV family protein with EDD domain
MATRIVTDSTCDLPQDALAQWGVEVIPLYITADNRTYKDRVDLTRETFYQRLPDWTKPPTTAAPGMDVFKAAYRHLAQEGAGEVLSIHISESLSATVSVARTAAEQTMEVPVTVLDSRQLSLGTGFVVETAAKMAQSGATAQEIVKGLQDQIARSHVFAALDTLEYLKRSGRMHWALAGIGGILQIKPVLLMHEGNPTVSRVRTDAKAMDYVRGLLEERAPFERVALVHTHASEKAELLRQKCADLLPQEELLSVDITPVIGANIGPGAVGFAVISAR